MSKNAKIALGIFGGLAVVVLAMCGGGYYWLESNGDRLREEGIRIEAEAQAFAKGADQEACVTEALRRLDTCDDGALADITCKAMASVFLNHCLPASQSAPGFCDDVPTADGIMDIANYTVDACSRRGRVDDQACARLMQKVHTHCNHGGREAP